MIDHRDTLPLSDFLRNHQEHIKRLQTGRQPEVLTIDGEAALVVLDPVSYQELLDQVERAAAIEGIHRGLADMEAGRGRPAEEFFAEFQRTHRIADGPS